MPAIIEVAEKYSLDIVEDCACGLGSKIKGRHCGSFGKAGILSFHPRKSITTGEGGIILTHDKSVADKASSLREHGAARSDLDRHHANGGFLLTTYNDLGYNYRMTDIQGALGVAQTGKLAEIMHQKAKLAAEYNTRLKDIAWLKAPFIPDDYTHSYQTYCTLFKPEESIKALSLKDEKEINRLHQERNGIMATLEQQGIATRQGTHAVHIQNVYKNKYDYTPMNFPAAYAADRLSLALPFYPTITNDEVAYLFYTLKSIST